MEREFFEIISRFYDKLMDDVDYREWAYYISSMIKNELPSVRKVLDISAGTGNLEIYMKDYEFVLMDLSEGMLKMAKRKGFENLVLADYRNLPFKDGTFDAVISTFDSLNVVLSEHELSVVFREVFRVLNLPGVFLFDMNTIHSFSTYWNGFTRIERTGEDYFIWRSRYIEPDRAELNIVVFEKFGKFYRKYESNLMEKAYPIKKVHILLKEAGFSRIYCFEHLSFRKCRDRSMRVQFVASKLP